MVSVTYANSDSASAPVIAALLGDAPADRAVTLGNYPWCETLWFMRATHGLPHYRAVWEAAPLAFAALGFALAVWMAARAFDRWTGAMVGAGLLAALAGGMWRFLLAPNAHGGSLVHVSVLGGALVLFLSWRARTAWLVLGAVVVAAVTAVGVASD